MRLVVALLLLLAARSWALTADDCFPVGAGACTTGQFVGEVRETGAASSVVNVKGYGALGDAKADDSAAIQRALDAGGPGATVLVPVGYYKASGLVVYQGQTIRGAGVCDITLGLTCGTILQPLSNAGSQTVFASKFPGGTDCKRSSPFTPKCADGVSFRDLVVIANGNNDIDFDLSNMSEVLLDRVFVYGRLTSGATGQIGILGAAVNNAGTPTGGLEVRVQNSKIFNLATGIELRFANASLLGPNTHIISNTTGVQIDGQCTGGTCTTGGALNPCLANADCTACSGTCSNATTNSGGLENDIHDNVIESNTTDIVNVGSFTKIRGNHIENGSGACIQVDERGLNTSITENSFSNNASCTASVQLTNSATAPVATRVIVRDNGFVGSGKYTNEANASTAVEVGRNNYSGAGVKVTMAASSGVRWVDTTEGIAFAGLAANGLGSAGNGGLLYCTDCTVANPCASGGTGAFAKRINSVWVCN